MKNRKAFTVVELVIVIAIIAVLAAVLIPTFATLIKKANVSKDTQLIRNLNTALATDNAENGGKGHRNMTEALEAAEKFGYDVDKINASETDNEILWDSKNDLFCYFDGSEIKYIPESELTYTKDNSVEEKRIHDVDYWVIRNVDRNSTDAKKNVSETYSTYLSGIDSSKTDITITKGLDVGKTNVLTSITYDRHSESEGQEVVIRTNGFGTVLTVNAPNDTVHHYDCLDELTITAVANASYHEHGIVRGKATIAQGHLVVEEDGYVNQLSVSGTTAAVSVDVKPKGTVVTAVIDNLSASVVIDSGAVVGQIVAENTNMISGAGATKLKENAVAKASVSNETEFDAALVEKKPYIVLTSDFSVTQQMHVVDYNVIIDGAGKTISTTQKDYQFLHVNKSNISVTINDLSYSSTNGKAFVRVGEDGTSYSGVKLNISGCTITEKYYALNLRKNLKCELNIINSTITGWAAINSWAYDSTININNSTMIGRSISNEGFGTLVFDGGAYFTEGATTFGLAVNVNNSTLKQITTGYASSEQYAISIQFGAKLCNVYLNNCTIVNEGEGVEELCCEFTKDNGSKVYNDDVLVYEGVEPQVWYSNGPFASDKTTSGSMNTTLKKPFDEYWMANGEGVILLADVIMNSNATCSMKEGSFYLYLDGHNVTGGKIIIKNAVSVISDTSGISSILGCSTNGYTIVETNNGNGTYTYSCASSN